MNVKNDDPIKNSQEQLEQRCTAPHPIVSFLFFLGTLLGTLVLIWLVISILS
jgi:hypothetical protein